MVVLGGGQFIMSEVPLWCGKLLVSVKRGLRGALRVVAPRLAEGLRVQGSGFRVQSSGFGEG